jgi:pre-rRNA-processing protein TSR2
MITRSKTTAQLRFDRKLQSALEKYPSTTLDAFRAGIGAVLRQWTALELAVFHQWGGPMSTTNAEALQDILFELYLGPEKVYKDDVALELEDYLETHFNCLCEDGSPEEIGQLLCIMWRECIAGDFTRVNELLAKVEERSREVVLRTSHGVTGGDAIEEGDEDDADGPDGMEMDEAERAIQAAMADQLTAAENTTLGGALRGVGSLPTVFEGVETAAATAGAMMMEEAEEVAELEETVAPPLIDEDGFQLVMRKGRKPKNNSNTKRKG